MPEIWAKTSGGLFCVSTRARLDLHEGKPILTADTSEEQHKDDHLDPDVGYQYAPFTCYFAS